MVSQNNSSYNNMYRFGGKPLDEETGLSYFGARYYDSKLSVWLSVDKLMTKHPDESPYIYCGNNPVNLVDPDGNDYILAVLGRDSKTNRITNLQVRATVYITGAGASKERAAELNRLAKNVYKTQKLNNAEVSYNINYVYTKNNPKKLKAGENVLAFNNKVPDNDLDRSHVNGRAKISDSDYQRFTGNSGEIYKGDDNNAVMHETGHFIGLPDRYDEIDNHNRSYFSEVTVNIHPGFSDDLMGNSQSQNLNPFYAKLYLDKANKYKNEDSIDCYLQIGRKKTGALVTPYEPNNVHIIPTNAIKH